MKKLEGFAVLVFLFLAIVLLSFASLAYAELKVKVIYFKTKVAEDIDIEKHDKMLKAIQKHYQSEMTKHGYEGYTFPLELDNSGKLVVHVIEGKHDGEHYDSYPSAYDVYMKGCQTRITF